MATDRELLKQAQAGHISSTGVTDPYAVVRRAHTIQFSFSKAADAMASTTTSETWTGLSIPDAGKVVAVYISTTAANVTADNTNYGTVTLSKINAAAGSKTTVATLTTTITSSGDITKGVRKAWVLSTVAGALDVVQGGSFTYEIAKAGSGVVVPACLVTIEVELT